MFTQKVKLRIFYLILFLTAIAAALFLIFKSLEENVVYFFSPTEIYNKSNTILDNKIRIGGLVKEGSTNKSGNTFSFIITDLKNEIIVSYEGLLPNLFSEGKGVVAEGKLKDKKYFIANKILAKHDENYMPPQVKDILNKTN